MGEQRPCMLLLYMCYVFLCMALASVDARLMERDESEMLVHCVHERNEQLVYGVQQLDQNGARRKRLIGEQYQPFRIYIHYDSTVMQLTTFQRNRLQNIIMPQVESNIEAALSVIPATSPILLDRDCVGGTFQLPIGSVRQCSTQCENQTLCVLAQVPEEHLKRCDQCNGNAPNCETIGSDGPGVNNTDYILYVGANPASPCSPFGGVLAFANLCQMEATLDRPIAGAINFCPNQFAVRSDEDNIRIGIHEVVHALGFSPTAYPFFRDEDGNPRTPRDQFGRPPTDAFGNFIVSNTTIRTTTYPDWQTRNGPINHEVLQFVTPNVVEQAQIHYNCSTIEGVELENQGGAGTRSAHFEQRILGNEGMTGVFLFNVRFSRVTFGLMEDTGWYRANYNMAEPLAWGQNTGCIIPHGSCGEWIETQQQKGATLAPYCNHLVQNPLRLGCTIDRELVSGCNLIDFGTTSIPTEFQYFNSGPNFNATVGARAGGSLQTPDYCPLQFPLMFLTGQSRVCNQQTDLPTPNLFAETYGPGSRCIEHGRQWFQTMSGTNTTSAVYGGGCYQYSCSPSMGVSIQVMEHTFQCDCEGEELILDIIGSGSRFQGSLICPSCGQLCFDNLSLCPNPEPAACYGRETFITVSTTEPFTCYQNSSSGICANEIGQTFSVSDCCNVLGGGAYTQNNGSCVPCPQMNNTMDNFYPFGVSEGDAEVPVALDGTSSPIFLSPPIRFFETTETTLFVNTNGHLSFRSGFFSFFPQRFPISFSPPLIAPFWDDVDIRQFGNIYYRQTSSPTLLERARNEIQELFPSSVSFFPTRLVIATWDRVAGFALGSQENSFQVVIATDGQRTFVFFIYGDIEWGFANIGFNAGDGVRSFMVPGALTSQSIDIEEGSNVGRTGVYLYRVDQCSIIDPNNAGSGFGSGSGSGAGVCCPLPNPANGQVQFPSTTVGSVATYSCFFGFALNGTSTRTCEADGEWSGDPPTCDSVDCGPLENPENGNVSLFGTTFGSSASYSCLPGYRLIGSSFRFCQASGNWSGSAPICQLIAEFGLGRQLYSTAEGDEDLEICVQLLQGNITQPTFINIATGSGTGTQSAQFPTDVLPLNTSILTFDVGDTQECVSIQVVDDDLLEDTESFFVNIFTFSFVATVQANRSFANVIISDNEVVMVGFDAPSYTVNEGANQVMVCVRLEGMAELFRPVQMRVTSSKDGTATADEDFRPVLQLVTLPVGSSSGSTQCISVSIIDDTEPETNEEFTLTLFASDVAVAIAPDGATTTIVIQDNEEFFIQFINDTPDVQGNQVTVSFTSSMPLASATCRAQPRPDQNCISQTAVFTGLPPRRRRPYDLIITATSITGQSASITRRFRTSTINDCWAHLINQGVVVHGNSATVEWQGTGPAPNNVVQNFLCSLDGGTSSSCTSPHELTQLAVGEHVLNILPQESDGIDCRRIFGLDVPFQIE